MEDREGDEDDLTSGVCSGLTGIMRDDDNEMNGDDEEWDCDCDCSAGEGLGETEGDTDDDENTGGAFPALAGAWLGAGVDSAEELELEAGASVALGTAAEDALQRLTARLRGVTLTTGVATAGVCSTAATRAASARCWWGLRPAKGVYNALAERAIETRRIALEKNMARIVRREG